MSSEEFEKEGDEIVDRHAKTMDPDLEELSEQRNSEELPGLEPTSVSQATEFSISQATAPDDSMQTLDLTSGHRVHFHTVEVREHAYTLGSGSHAGGGVSTDLAWEAQSVTISTLDEYEASRGPRQQMMRKSDQERRHILEASGFGEDEFEVAAKEGTEKLHVHRIEEKNEQYEDFQYTVKPKEVKKKAGGIRALSVLFTKKKGPSFGDAS